MTLVYNIGKDRIGAEEGKEKSNIKQTQNRSEQKIKHFVLRKELNDVNRHYKKSNEIEKLRITCLTDSVREDLRRTGRTEQLKNKKKKKNRANVSKNPYNHIKTLLGGERTGHLH